MDSQLVLTGLVERLQQGLDVNVEGLLALQNTVTELLNTLSSEAEDLKALSVVSSQKQVLIQGKLSKLPDLKRRIEALAKRLLDIHNQIQQLRKWTTSRK